LADYVDRHPDALLRGRRPQTIPATHATSSADVNP
jgi:hypothetical protein